jgi:predicted transcriptional regulator
MRTVTLDVRPLSDSLSDFARTWRGRKPDASARISFDRPELLWRVLTSRRWDLLRYLAGQGPTTLREAARRVQRDVKGVHTDVHALLDAGILRRTDDGKIEFPFDAVHVDFVLRAA